RDQPKDTQNAGNLPGVSAIYSIKSDSWDFTDKNELVELRKSIDKDSTSSLIEHLGATYSKFLSSAKVNVVVNDQLVESIEFDNWAYPPSYEPINYIGNVSAEDGSEVIVNAVAGLTIESSPAGGEYGVYFYCNDRLVARALKTIDVGFTTGYAGKPHADISLTRVIVSLNGNASLMPWNSSKSDINSSHEIFVALQAWLLRTVKDYASLSRRLSKQDGGWNKQVFGYKKGAIRIEKIEDFPNANTTYLPPLPIMKPRYSAVVTKANATISNTKPWTTGLYESIIAADWILKQNFSQKNRIALIILDSTLEIAFKEYLVNDSGQRYAEQRLLDLFRNRISVHSEIKNYVNISNRDWKMIEHYYDQRCQLIHKRASVSIDDRAIANFRSVVERVLKKLFSLHFG
ncbi:MAG: ATP-binding protein, partial [Gammaproteobacteria bacterium]|nr:ATP-binding protein [Gammaproteobacteria bacterium]